VPASYIRRTLDVRVGERLVEIFDGAQLVTTHVRQERGRATRTEHYPLAGRLFLTQNPAACLAHALALGPATTALVAALLERPLLSRLREAQALLRLDERYPAERLERACGRALAAADGRDRTVRASLERDLDRLAEEEAPATTPVAGAFLRGPLAFGGEDGR
jgi:hypothetical protein